MKFHQAIAVLTTTPLLAAAYPHLQQENGKAPCPMARRTEEALATAEAGPRIAAWEAWERTSENIPEEPLVERLYQVGVVNDGEEFCSGDSTNKCCNKASGPWGDAIPQDGEYCIWAMLEFQDSLEYNFGMPFNNTNTTSFLGTYQAVLDSLPQNGEVKIFGGSLGIQAGQPHAVPWPTASIIWNNGNQHAKPWIDNIHRPLVHQHGLCLGLYRPHPFQGRQV